MRSRANECLLNAAMLAGVVGLGLRHRARRHSANSLATLARCSFADWLDSVTVVELHQALSSAEDKVSSTFHHITSHHITITSHYIAMSTLYSNHNVSSNFHQRSGRNIRRLEAALVTTCVWVDVGRSEKASEITMVSSTSRAELLENTTIIHTANLEHDSTSITQPIVCAQRVTLLVQWRCARIVESMSFSSRSREALLEGTSNASTVCLPC